jgi:hypothetical protein
MAERAEMTIVGPVPVTRMGYGARGTTSLPPRDAALNLPPEPYAHGVPTRVAAEAAKTSCEETVAAVTQTTATFPSRSTTAATRSRLIGGSSYKSRTKTFHRRARRCRRDEDKHYEIVR